MIACEICWWKAGRKFVRNSMSIMCVCVSSGIVGNMKCVVGSQLQVQDHILLYRYPQVKGEIM